MDPHVEGLGLRSLLWPVPTSYRRPRFRTQSIGRRRRPSVVALHPNRQIRILMVWNSIFDHLLSATPSRQRKQHIRRWYFFGPLDPSRACRFNRAVCFYSNALGVYVLLRILVVGFFDRCSRYIVLNAFFRHVNDNAY